MVCVGHHAQLSLFSKQKYGYSLMFFNFIILNFSLAYWQHRYNVNTFFKIPMRNQESALESGMVVLIKQNWIAGMGPDSLLRQCQANVTSHTIQGCLLIYNVLISGWQVTVKSSALKNYKRPPNSIGKHHLVEGDPCPRELGVSRVTLESWAEQWSPVEHTGIQTALERFRKCRVNNWGWVNTELLWFSWN